MPPSTKDLSRAEIELLQCLHDNPGSTLKQAAEKLNKSIKTVDIQASAAREILGAANTKQAVRIALLEGYLKETSNV